MKENSMYSYIKEKYESKQSQMSRKGKRKLKVKEVHPVSSLGTGHKPFLGKCPRAGKVIRNN